MRRQSGPRFSRAYYSFLRPARGGIPCSSCCRARNPCGLDPSLLDCLTPAARPPMGDDVPREGHSVRSVAHGRALLAQLAPASAAHDLVLLQNLFPVGAVRLVVVHGRNLRLLRVVRGSHDWLLSIGDSPVACVSKQLASLIEAVRPDGDVRSIRVLQALLSIGDSRRPGVSPASAFPGITYSGGEGDFPRSCKRLPESHANPEIRCSRTRSKPRTRSGVSP